MWAVLWVLVVAVLAWPYIKRLYHMSHKNSTIAVPFVPHDKTATRKKWGDTLYDMKNRTYLVTGGAGRLGGAIVKLLIKRGATRIIIMDFVEPKKQRPGVKFVKGDICNYASMKRIFEEQQIHTVFHTAASIDIQKSFSFLKRVNVDGTSNVIRCCVEHGVLQLIYTSSATVIETMYPHKNVSENHPYPAYYGDFQYARSKAMAEREVLNNNGNSCLMTTSLRFENMIAPSSPAVLYSITPAGIIFGDGKALQSFVFVENVALAHVLAAEKMLPEADIAGKVYMINDERFLSWGDFLTTIRKLFDLPCKKYPFFLAYLIFAVLDFVNFITFPFMGGDKLCPPSYVIWEVTTSYTFDDTRAKNELGYLPIKMEVSWDKLVKAIKKMQSKKKA